MTAASVSPATLVEQARRLGVTLHVDDHGAIRAKPSGMLPADLRAAIRDRKTEIVQALDSTPAWPTSPPLDQATAITPFMRVTIVTTDDHDADLDHLRAIFNALRDAPGGNRVLLRICDAGQVTVLEYRALTDRALRRTMAGLLRERAGYPVTDLPHGG